MANLDQLVQQMAQMQAEIARLSSASVALGKANSEKDQQLQQLINDSVNKNAQIQQLQTDLLTAHGKSSDSSKSVRIVTFAA